MAGILTRDDILSAVDSQIELVEVPEWGGSVYVRSLTGAERDAYEQSLIEMVQNGKKQVLRTRMDNARAKLCARTICDESGQRLFSDRDVEALGQKSASALDRVFAAARRLSALSDEDIAELVDGLKNGQSDGSSSD